MWKDTCNLLSKTDSVDSQGNLTYITTSSTVYCSIQSVKASEYYQAASVSLKPELVIVIRGIDYGGQELIEYNNSKYKVIRTFVKGDNIELTVAGVKS